MGVFTGIMVLLGSIWISNELDDIRKEIVKLRITKHRSKK